MNKIMISKQARTEQARFARIRKKRRKKKKKKLAVSKIK
jgi:hypothetical protein